MEIGLHEVDQLAAGVEAQIDLGMLLIEVAEPRQQPLLQERAEQADVEQAAAAILPQLFDGARELAHAALDARQQPRTLRGEAHRAAVPYEQRRFEKFFQRFDMRADGGGRDVQRIGGVRETQMGGDGFEGTQRVQRNLECSPLRQLFRLSSCIHVQIARCDRENIWNGLTMQAA